MKLTVKPVQTKNGGGKGKSRSKINKVRTMAETPLMERVKKFSKWEDIKQYLGVDRKVRQIPLQDCPYIFFDAKIDTFKNIRDMPITKSLEDGSKVESNESVTREVLEYGLNDLTASKLKSGSLTALFKMVDHVDGKNQNDDLINQINDIISEIWDIHRNKNQRTSPIYVMEEEAPDLGIFDVTYVTDRFEREEDLNFLENCLATAKMYSPNIEFVNGEVTVVRTKANFAITKETVLEKALSIGFSAVNSEFKWSAAEISNYIYIPDYNIGINGTNITYKKSIRHIGSDFSLRVSSAIKEVFGSVDDFKKLFVENITRADAMQIDTDIYDKNDEKKIPLLMKACRISNKTAYGDLLTIMSKKGYARSVAGFTFAVMDYSTNVATTIDERENYNAKAMTIVEQPELYSVDSLISRANAMDLSDDSDEDSSQRKVDDKY